MPSPIDFDKLLSDSLAIFKANAKGAYEEAKPYAEHEFRQLAEDTVFLAKLRANNEINDEELKHRLEMQKLAAANVLLAVKSIGLVAAQNTVNAIIALLIPIVKASLGVTLPI